MKSIFLTACILFFLDGAFGHPAWGMAIDPSGAIYFPDIGHNGRGTLWKYKPDGTLIAVFKNFHCHSASVDAWGNIYAAHGEDQHYLVKISPEGRVDTVFYTTDLQTFYGGNCTVSPAGKIYFGLNKTVYRLEAGAPHRVSRCSIEWNQLLFTDAQENLYATDIGVGNGVLYRIDSSGNCTQIADDLISHLNRPKDKHNDILLGGTVDVSGNVYLCELAGKRIFKIAPDGSKSVVYTSEGDWFPAALTFHDGKLFILENGTSDNPGPRLSRMNSAGEREELVNADRYAPPQQQEADQGHIQEPTSTLWGWTFLGLGLLALFIFMLKRR
jgi:sugar lactone lactonase YvrE